MKKSIDLSSWNRDQLSVRSSYECDLAECKTEENESVDRIDRSNIALSPIKYFKNSFVEMCKSPRTVISTGYWNLDEVLNGGLVPELYVLGAETSTGKSAFAIAMAQNIAAKGTKVLYYSTEMSKREIIARGVASISLERNEANRDNRCFTTGDILYLSCDLFGTMSQTPYEDYQDYSEEYFKRYGDHLILRDAGFMGLSARDIAHEINWLCQESSEPMVVILDYLQALKPSDWTRFADRRSTIDEAITILKQLSVIHDIPIFVLSSISRGSYGGSIQTSSYKESGCLEYTGGILIGWSPFAESMKKGPKAGDSDSLYQSTDPEVRIMKFDIIKNRNGVITDNAHLFYYPAYNYFSDHYLRISRKCGQLRNENSNYQQTNKLKNFCPSAIPRPKSL